MIDFPPGCAILIRARGGLARLCGNAEVLRRVVIPLITLRNAQVRRISWVPWGSAGREAVRVASS